MTAPHELLQRANINVRHTSVGDVVIYEDHRTILNVLFCLKQQNSSAFPLNVILFDDHDDACTPSKQALKVIRKFNKKEPTLKDFWSFTEFDLRGLDDDWVKAGMELGLINNYFLFNATQASLGSQEAYATVNFGNKHLYNLGYIWDALSHRGRLYDVVKHAEYGQLWSDFGWNYSKESSKFSFQPPKAYISDFDLDCFTTTVLDKRIAIPRDILIEKFKESRQPTYHFYYSYLQFVKDLIQNSELTTICFENNFCGGFNQAFEIFKTIDYLFFEEELGKPQKY